MKPDGARPVWVLGAQGMLGQAVCRLLVDRGVAHVGSGRAVDVTQPLALARFAAEHAPRALINCAAFAKVDACESETAQAEAVNGTAPGHIAAVAGSLGAPAVHVSTDYVFAGDATAPYTEQSPCAPLGAYGRSKRLGEERFWAALPAAAPGFVVRTSWLFGHGGPNFVATMLRLMGEREAIRVVADQRGCPTFCDDLAAALLGLLGLDTAAGRPCAPGTYHFANAGTTSWHGFAEAIAAQARAAGRPLRCQKVEPICTADFPTPARRPAYSVLCTGKIGAALGRPPRPWAQALGDYLTSGVAAGAA